MVIPDQDNQDNMRHGEKEDLQDPEGDSYPGTPIQEDGTG